MAAIDEVVFHQLLAWHHSYDPSTPTAGLFSDVMLHAAELVVTALLFATSRRSWAATPRPARARLSPDLP